MAHTVILAALQDLSPPSLFLFSHFWASGECAKTMAVEFLIEPLFLQSHMQAPKSPIHL